MLVGYSRPKRDFLVRGFKYGFRIGFTGPSTTVLSQNHNSVKLNPKVVDDLILKETRAGRLSGPFAKSPYTNYRISPIGLVPKKDGNFRLIHDLSYPKGSSVNDGIPAECRSVSYEPLNNAISYILSQGSGVTLSKIDIKSAFRICPVHPADRHLLGFEWNNKLYFDKVLAMGLASSCRIFELVSSALKWIVLKNLRNVYLAKVLDDFLLVTAADHPCPVLAFDLMRTIFRSLGVPLAEEKSVAPCKSLLYLGLVIDVRSMCVKLPVDKVQQCSKSINCLMVKKKAKVKEIQSLCGLLQFACRAVVPGRAFLRRLYDSVIGVGNPNYYIRVSLQMKEDLAVWLDFLDNYNGRTMFLPALASNPHYCIITDASKSVGFGAICGDMWLYGVWPWRWSGHNITVLELGPIVFALATWSHHFENKSLHVKTDNLALTSVINKQTSSDAMLMVLVRKMVKLLLRHNILLRASHIDGHANVQADALSRGRFDVFQRLHPSAAPFPSTIPAEWDPSNWAPPLPT